MPVLARALTVLLVLLVGCEKPAPSDYWSGGAKAAARAGGGEASSFDKLMAEGTRANLSGRPTEAEARFRAALSEQRKLHGNNSPLLALPLMSLALQLSALNQFPQSDAQFAEAERVLAGADNRAMKARLLHYRGIHMLDEKKPAEAEALLGAAQAAYTELVPPEALTREPAPKPVRNHFDINGRITTGTSLKLLGTDPTIQPLLLGLIEVVRYRAIALRALGRASDAYTLTSFAARVASANDLGRPSVFARVFRTSGVTAEEGSEQRRALADLRRSDNDFEAALPGTRPAAEAALIHAGVLMRSGDTGAALSNCRRAVSTLVAIGAGTSPELMAPCLDAYAGGGMFGSGSGNRAEMFLAAQVAQGTITSHQIAQASASLAENARDPKIGAALKQRDELQREADRVYRALDTLGGAAASGRAGDEIAALQKQADQTQAALLRAEAEVRTLSPNYGQLVQDVVPASTVFAALNPNEAFVALFLSKDSGWAFALRNGDIAVSKIQGGINTIGPLVKAIRAGIEKTAVNALPTFDIDDARRVYDLTLGGVAASIKGASSLVIAPTGPLLSLPFELLLTGPADLGNLARAPWLVRGATITHVPAATNFVSLRKVANSSAASKAWFGFGDFRPVTVAQANANFPVAQCGDSGRLLASLPALPGAVKELDGARAVLAASTGDELTGDAFTAESVLKRSLKDYRILHFAAHALLPTDLRCQTEAAIVTSPPVGSQDAKGALLTASKVLGLDLDANLVILSACNSGGPGGGAGESLSGLARSFFFAKARSLLVTHWEVSDQVAALLVVLTINGLKEKSAEGVTGALREAQLNLLDRAASGQLPAEIAHPFFWAPFAVIGEGGTGGGRSTVSSRISYPPPDASPQRDSDCPRGIS